ncbi:MAG: SulP family inorganic anion transporter [Lewinella sp.]|nr:SulP family inorganic anion transporter [Lewinella sp.]
MNQQNTIPKGLIPNLKYDLPASIVVFLVAVPLCLGIALASGAPLFSGVIAGIVGGLLVGTLSGSPLGVSGPAAGLAVIVLAAINQLGFSAFLVAVVLGGVFQLALGFARAGIIGYYFPSSVIKGMLSGIGILIFLKQIPHAFGYDEDFEGSMTFETADGHNTFSELYYMMEAVSPAAMIITAVCLGILILWEQPFMKRNRIFQLIQGPLVAVVAGIVLNLIFQSTGSITLAPEHLVAIPVAESLSGFFGQFQFPDFSAITNPEIYITGLTIAVVASLETLLCLEATDKLDPFKRVSPANQELKAQGVGNIVSGLLGGLPVTQVIVRSSTNIQSGGRTKGAAIYHGILLLLCVMAIPFVLNMIPLASLAAILFMVGYKLAKPSLFKAMYRQGWAQFIPFIVTIVGIIMTDLLIGIGLGLGVAIFYVLRNNYKKPYFFHPEEHVQGERIRLELSEDVTFLNKAAILQTLNHLPDNSKVVIDASNTVEIDYDVQEIIEDFKQNAAYRGIDVEVIDRRRPGSPKENPAKVFAKVISDRTNGKGALDLIFDGSQG